MTHRLIATVMAVLMTIAVTPGTARANVERPARILIVGDSVTQGYKGDATWRYFLWHALGDADVPVDFVGPRAGTFYVHPDGTYDWNYTGEGAYADPSFDQDHGATYGGRIGRASNWFYDPIGTQVEQQQPDVIVSLWGVNDLGDEAQGPADVIASYRDWFAQARAADPDVDFVVGRLPYTWLYDGEVTTFNEMIGDLAAELTTERSRIAVATMNEPYTRAGDSSDYVHPNFSGQAKIAAMIGSGLLQLLDPSESTEPALPIPPAPVTSVSAPPTVAIAPPAKQSGPPAAPRWVRAERHGLRVVVRWRKVPRADTYRVRCGGRSKVVTGRRAVLRVWAPSCAVKARGMSGSSPWARVRIRG